MLTNHCEHFAALTLKVMPFVTEPFHLKIHMIIIYYYTTKLLGGLIQKIHQSDRAIAGLIFSKYQTGSVRIRPEIELFKMGDAEEIEVCKLSA